MTKGKPTLVKKNKKTLLLTAEMIANINYKLISRKIFHEEQKGCSKRSRGTEELLYIDQHILNENKTRRKKIQLCPGLTTKKSLRYGPLKVVYNTVSECIKYPTTL